jgi:hypothetical protein
MTNGQDALTTNQCHVCTQCTAKLELHICGDCGHVWVDDAQNPRFALVEIYRALGLLLAKGPKEDLGNFMEATEAILDHTKQALTT